MWKTAETGQRLSKKSEVKPTFQRITVAAPDDREHSRVLHGGSSIPPSIAWFPTPDLLVPNIRFRKWFRTRSKVRIDVLVRSFITPLGSRGGFGMYGDLWGHHANTPSMKQGVSC